MAMTAARHNNSTKSWLLVLSLLPSVVLTLSHLTLPAQARTLSQRSLVSEARKRQLPATSSRCSADSTGNNDTSIPVAPVPLPFPVSVSESRKKWCQSSPPPLLDASIIQKMKDNLEERGNQSWVSGIR